MATQKELYESARTLIETRVINARRCESEGQNRSAVMYEDEARGVFLLWLKMATGKNIEKYSKTLQHLIHPEVEQEGLDASD